MRGVVTLAGEGTRMLPVTRGLRKEMLPLFYRGRDGVPVLAPVAHLVVRTLYGAGVTSITMVAGRDVEAVVRYFTPDTDLLARHAHHQERLTETLALDEMLARLRLNWVVQSAPRGFGNALLEAEDSVGDSPFLLHAADALLLEPVHGGAMKLMADLREREKAAAVVFVREVKDPRRYGVVEGTQAGTFRDHSFLRVTGMEEKPKEPKSSWAATALYVFESGIFRALRAVDGTERELEVTSGIARLIGQGKKVLAVVSDASKERWISVGSPEGYFEALRASYEHSRTGAI